MPQPQQTSFIIAQVGSSYAMRWEQMRQVRPDKFWRLVGVMPAVFEQMRAAVLASEPVSTHPLKGARRGSKPKLALEDRLLRLLI